jgi:hypothetical protein
MRKCLPRVHFLLPMLLLPLGGCAMDSHSFQRGCECALEVLLVSAYVGACVLAAVAQCCCCCN